MSVHTEEVDLYFNIVIIRYHKHHFFCTSRLFSYGLLVMVLLYDKEIYRDGKKELVCHFLMHTLL